MRILMVLATVIALALPCEADLHSATLVKASWYGPRFHGRPTASGVRYDQYALTAAHRSLPLGTYARVTHPETGKQVDVLINDRGPYWRGRQLDLSYAAAEEIGLLQKGVARVWLQVIPKPPDPPWIWAEPL